MRETPCSPTRQIHTDIAINTADDVPFHCFPPPAWSRDRLFWYNFFLPSGIAYWVSCLMVHPPTQNPTLLCPKIRICNKYKTQYIPRH